MIEETLFPTTSRGNYTNKCKICTAEYKVKWKQQNNQRVKEQNARWRINNIDMARQSVRAWHHIHKNDIDLQNKKALYSTEYYKRNKIKFATYSRQYYQKHSQQAAPYNKQWIIKNPDKVQTYRLNSATWHKANKEHRRLYYSNRYRTDPQYRIRLCIRSRTRKIIKSQGAIKKTTTLNLIGCTWDELIKYMTAQFHPSSSGVEMNWDNCGKDGWEIDHIQPLYTFNLIDPLQQIKAFHYTNLQPLWIDEHKAKTYSDVYGEVESI